MAVKYRYYAIIMKFPFDDVEVALEPVGPGRCRPREAVIPPPILIPPPMSSEILRFYYDAVMAYGYAPASVCQKRPIFPTHVDAYRRLGTVMLVEKQMLCIAVVFPHITWYVNALSQAALPIII